MYLRVGTRYVGVPVRFPASPKKGRVDLVSIAQ